MATFHCFNHHTLNLRSQETFEWGVSTLAGARPDVIRFLERGHQVEARYQTKWNRSKCVSKLMTSLAFFDTLRFNRLKRKLDQLPPPVFILGHWRSGTTLLHNILCDITDAAYCTTYQNLFPNNLFAFYNIIQPAVQLFMPKKRPADNLKMHTLYPQEEEFALGNEVPFCFYYWMFFPKDTLEFSDQFLTAKAAQPQHLEAWKRNYLRFVKRCILLTGGRQFISKNPPNTARIPLLLELFPDAKFIFLHRNPYEVVRSTFRFYKGVLPAQQHQSISDEELETQVLRIYQELHDKFLNDRSLIPKGNLVELAFENFVADPLNTARTIMDQFGVPTQIKPRTWQKYGQNHRGAKHYEYSPGWIQQVNTQLGTYFEEFEYAMQKD